MTKNNYKTISHQSIDSSHRQTVKNIKGYLGNQSEETHR
jgi:hypothetical protein